MKRDGDGSRRSGPVAEHAPVLASASSGVRAASSAHEGMEAAEASRSRVSTSRSVGRVNLGAAPADRSAQVRRFRGIILRSASHARENAA